MELTNGAAGTLFLTMRKGFPKKIKWVFWAVSALVFSINSQASKPIVTLLNPDNGTAGDKIRILGQNFNEIMGITFNGVLAPSFVVTAQNQLEVTVPAGANSGPISVQNSSGIGISEDIFTIYNPGPRPFSFEPAKGQVNDIVTILGDKFTSQTQVYFHNNIRATQVEIVAQGELRVVVPAEAQTGPITLAGPFGSNTTARDFNVVVSNDLEFSITTPSQTFSVGETSFVDWKIKSLSLVESIDVELTLLIPDRGIVLEKVHSDIGTPTSLGRFYQISNVNIPAGESWVGRIQFIPTDSAIPFSFEGSIASPDEDPNSENNSMVTGYSATIRQPEIAISVVQNGKVKLEWPAYPSDWQVIKKSGLQPFSFWTLETSTPSLNKNKKFIIINPTNEDGDLVVYQLRR